MNKEDDFIQVYIEAVLTRDILTENDLILLLKAFGLGSFEEYSGDKSSLGDMSYVLINEVGPKKLFSEIRRTMEEEYADRLNFEEIRDCYDNLANLELGELNKFYEKNFHKDKLKSTADEYDLIVIILGELLKMQKSDAKFLFKK